MNQQRFPASIHSARIAALLSCLAAAALSACGGGSEQASAQATVESTTIAAPATTGFAGVLATPTFHMAPAPLEEPSDAAVASATPYRFQIDASLADLSTTRLTPDVLAQHIATLHQRARVESTTGTQPAATAITAAVYTPAQIRAAYGLPVLPALGATLSATDAAAFGAGQTIYIVDAFDHPNAFADLDKFNTKFGLPGCTGVALTATSALPLSKAGSTCTFSVAYTDSRAALNSAAPAYNSGWIAEIALDVQWAHAIAPLARIVLIEVSDANTNTLLGGVALANKMGAGVVSMSFGASEGNWVKSSDASFGSAGMTYVAAAGDGGAQALWPAVSSKVLAVGGTSLQWSGTGTRREVAWSSSGGGVSAYEALPTWQADTLVPGAGAAKMRTVCDVAFNANPNTGQYVALTEKGSTTTTWYAYGGTSIGAPQWAGLVAVANARRVAASKALLGDFHATLYKTIAGSGGIHAGDFADIVEGNDGSCATCDAAPGFDTVTGWGTPNASALLNTLVTDSTSAGTATPTPTAGSPVVPGGTFSAQTGTAFSQSLGISAPSGVTPSYALSGGPSGLTVNVSGVVNWAAPVAGSYSFTATASTSAGKSASGRYSLSVVAVNHAPTLASGTITGKAGWSLTTLLPGKDADGDAMTYAMTGAPTGLTLSKAGVLAWSKAVKGRYSLKVTVKDAHGLSSTPATVTVVVNA
ncbi:MAG: peptidase S53 [Burkholderiaceae bacterium]